MAETPNHQRLRQLTLFDLPLGEPRRTPRPRRRPFNAASNKTLSFPRVPFCVSCGAARGIGIPAMCNSELCVFQVEHGHLFAVCTNCMPRSFPFKGGALSAACPLCCAHAVRFFLLNDNDASIDMIMSPYQFQQFADACRTGLDTMDETTS